MYTVPCNSMLYRATPVVETEPRPKICNDTYKRGVYFALNHPYLAENMCIEYESDLNIAVYKTKQEIRVIIGKYTSDEGSHIDEDIEPITDTNILPRGKYYESHKSTELFLVSSDLQKIQFIGCYFLTYKDAVRRWEPLE